MLEIDKYNKIIIANWKLNGTSSFLRSFLNNLKLDKKHNNTCIIICLPFPLINQIPLDFILSGAQDCSIYIQGPYTGETSTKILKDSGCDFCIIGHSERRNIFNESDEIISEKAIRCIEENIIPILCIGETLEQNKNKETKEVLINQINKCIPKEANKSNMIVAYEPIWAIGTGFIPTLNEICETHTFIKYNIPRSKDFKILYGGSVKSSNSEEIMSLGSVDGGLVGGASINIDEFNKIIKF